MREFLAEVHHRAWIATGLAGALAAACASAHLALPAALAAMTAGAIMIWISEEETRLLAAMVADEAFPAAPGDAAVSAPAPAPAPAPIPAAVRVRVRDWTSPFPAPRPARRQRPQGRRVHRQLVAAATLPD
jgi:hypothetical protein